MIKQIDEKYFEKFDNSEGEQQRYASNSLIIQYANKIRELVNAVNKLTEETKN